MKKRVLVGYEKHEDVLLPVWGEIEIKTFYTMMYHEDLHVLYARLDKAAINFIGFLLQGDVTKEVVCNKYFAERFNEYEKLVGGPEYHLATVGNVVSDLCKEEVLVRVGRGVYRINPKFFWRGDVRLREECIEQVYKLAADYKLKGDKGKEEVIGG